MKLLLSLLFVSVLLTESRGQSDSVKTRNIIGFIPSKVDRINGVAIGPFESKLDGKGQSVNGITVDIIGQGGLLLMAVGNDPIRLKDKYEALNQDSIVQKLNAHYDTVTFKTIYRGIVVAGSGIIVDQINGISVGGIISSIENVNGLMFNILNSNVGELNGVSIGLVNQSLTTKGVQIGLVNKTYDLKGIQIGLWNKNRKRSFPIINW